MTELNKTDTHSSAVGWGEFANPNVLCATICWGSYLTPTYLLILMKGIGQSLITSDYTLDDLNKAIDSCISS